jgi:hypothetical protein
VPSSYFWSCSRISDLLHAHCSLVASRLPFGRRKGSGSFVAEGYDGLASMVQLVGVGEYSWLVASPRKRQVKMSSNLTPIASSQNRYKALNVKTKYHLIGVGLCNNIIIEIGYPALVLIALYADTVNAADRAWPAEISSSESRLGTRINRANRARLFRLFYNMYTPRLDELLRTSTHWCTQRHLYSGPRAFDLSALSQLRPDLQPLYSLSI